MEILYTLPILVELQTRSTQVEIASLTKQLEAKDQELKDLQEKHKNLHTRLDDLQERISVRLSDQNLVSLSLFKEVLRE